MISDYNKETLTLHAENVEQKTDALDHAKLARDNIIRDILNAGGMPTEISQLANLSRERVYQIKDGRR